MCIFVHKIGFFFVCLKNIKIPLCTPKIFHDFITLEFIYQNI